MLSDLAHRGHELLVVAGRDDGTAKAPVPVSIARPLAETRRARRASEALEAEVRAFRPDVIHLHNAIGPEVLGWGAARGAVATVQDHRVFCPGRGKLTEAGETCDVPMSAEACAGCFREGDYFRRIYEVTAARRDALRGMAGITVLSSYMKRELSAAGISAERIQVIPPFVHGIEGWDMPAGDAAADTDAGGAPCVAFIGRLARAKGVYDAIEAWRRAEAHVPLVFAGTGPERERLEELGFEVTGWLGRRELSALYRRALAVVMPSRWQEPFGIVGLEALAAGVPVAAWDSGGIAEWHPGPLPAWGDVSGLARELRSALAGERRAEPPRLSPRAELTARLETVYARATDSS